MKYVLAFLVALPCAALASKYHWKVLTDSGERSVGDAEQTPIVVGDWACVIGKADLNDMGTESRRVGCSVGKGLQVYNHARCFKSSKTGRTENEIVSFQLQQKNEGSKSIILSCH